MAALTPTERETIAALLRKLLLALEGPALAEDSPSASHNQGPQARRAAKRLRASRPELDECSRLSIRWFSGILTK
jgi:hypothetical protein